jgi:hypothetical protein
MSTKANIYIDQSLAACGFAVLDSTIACTLRPDLWHSGMEAAGDFSPRFFQPSGRVGVTRYKGFFEGREDRPIEILARSSDRLALRVEWVTGAKLTDLYEVVASPVGTPVTPTVPRSRATQIAGDLYQGVETKESARSCGECEHLSVAGRCLRAQESSLEWPQQNALRRCLAFTPKFDSRDSRSGLQLWPEIVNAKRP